MLPSRRGSGLLLDSETSSLAQDDSEVPNFCRICWSEGGHLAFPCRCTTGVHDECLLKWLLSENGRNLDTCELCIARWEGDITVPISNLLEQVASWKRSQPDAAEVSAALGELRHRNSQLQGLLEQAAEAEAGRRQDFQRIRRVAAADRRAILARLDEERCWRRSSLRFLPPLLLAAAGAFLAGWQHGTASRRK